MFVQPKNPRLVREHEAARQLRYLGVSVKRIASHLGVSQSTVSIWVRDIELLPRHRASNLKRAGEARGKAWSQRFRQQRRGFQEEGRRRALKGEALHVAGCMLYWAEGSKHRNTAQFCNADPAMHIMFLRFLRDCFDVPNADLRFRLNVYTTNGRSIDEIERYWIDLLRLDRSCARKHVVNHFPTSSSGKKVNKLPYGVCTLTVSP